MKKTLFSILLTTLFMISPANKTSAQFFGQPYYGGLNGYGSYYSKGGSNYGGFNYSYPRRPNIVVTPYGIGIYNPYPSPYGYNPYRGYPRYPHYNRDYPGYVYPW